MWWRRRKGWQDKEKESEPKERTKRTILSLLYLPSSLPLILPLLVLWKTVLSLPLPSSTIKQYWDKEGKREKETLLNHSWNGNESVWRVRWSSTPTETRRGSTVVRESSHRRQEVWEDDDNECKNKGAASGIASKRNDSIDRKTWRWSSGRIREKMCREERSLYLWMGLHLYSVQKSWEYLRRDIFSNKSCMDSKTRAKWWPGLWVSSWSRWIPSVMTANLLVLLRDLVLFPLLLSLTQEDESEGGWKFFSTDFQEVVFVEQKKREEWKQENCKKLL